MTYCPLCGGLIKYEWRGLYGSCNCESGWVRISTMDGTSYPLAATYMYSVDSPDYMKRRRSNE